MGKYRTDDPVADFLAYDADQQKALARLPVCADCTAVLVLAPLGLWLLLSKQCVLW